MIVDEVTYRKILIRIIDKQMSSVGKSRRLTKAISLLREGMIEGNHGNELTDLSLVDVEQSAYDTLKMYCRHIEIKYSEQVVMMPSALRFLLRPLIQRDRKLLKEFKVSIDRAWRKYEK